MLSGDVHHEVEEILRHVDDLDKVRWYEVRWADKEIFWRSESNASNCWEKVKDYFAKQRFACRELPRRTRRSRKEIKEQQLWKRQKPQRHLSKAVSKGTLSRSCNPSRREVRILL